MKNSTLQYLIIFIVLFSAGSREMMMAQTDEREIFREAAGMKSLIYRGTMAPEYNFRYNGHCYAQTQEFLEGYIMYNDRFYENVLLNIDASADLMLVRHMIAMSLVGDYVDYAVIGGQRYVNLEYKGRFKGAPHGFCKELFSSENIKFYSKVSKILSSDEGYHNGKDIGYEDPWYNEYVETPSGNLKVLKYFRYVVKYYVVHDSQAVQIRNKKSFLKLLQLIALKDIT